MQFSRNKILQGSFSNVLRLLLSMLVAVVLPPILVRNLPRAEYSAWILILQLSAYVNLLDLGLQTMISKLVAENHTREQHDANRNLLSTSTLLLALLAALGVGLVLVMVWRVPQLFQQMPPALYPQVRAGLLLLGISSAVALPFTPFIAIFAGLQEYGFPTVVSLVGRLLSAAVLIVLALRHSSLVQMASAIAATNLLTAALQIGGWRRYVRRRIPFSFPLWDQPAASALIRSGGVVALWSLGGVLVSGLDTLIVGHFDFVNTGFYALAATATNALVLVVTNLFSPLLPAVSTLQVNGTPEDIGRFLLRASRYCTTALCALALPLLVFAFPVLTLWAGHTYAIGSVWFLEILVVSNCIRQLAYPYSLVVIGTGQQRSATLATLSEAVVNFTLSLVLARRMGAQGVALGTFFGALVSVGLHLLVSMPKTRDRIKISISQFVVEAFGKPLLCATALVILAGSWTRYAMWPASPLRLVAWAVCTLACLVSVGLTAEDRQKLRRWTAGKLPA